MGVRGRSHGAANFGQALGLTRSICFLSMMPCGKDCRAILSKCYGPIAGAFR